jgi:hypothetical protein
MMILAMRAFAPAPGSLPRGKADTICFTIALSAVSQGADEHVFLVTMCDVDLHSVSWLSQRQRITVDECTWRLTALTPRLSAQSEFLTHTETAS